MIPVAEGVRNLPGESRGRFGPGGKAHQPRSSRRTAGLRLRDARDPNARFYCQAM